MKKKELSEEQIKARDERRERWKGHCAKFAAMSEVERVALVQKVGAVVTCAGHQVAFKNTALLILQCPIVSVVGGFNQWKAAGRRVMKGAKALSMWAPGASPKDGESGEDVRFFTVNVFDISQTEPLPA